MGKGDDSYKPPSIVVQEMDGSYRILDPKDPEDLKLIRKQIGLQLVTGDKSGDKKALGGAIEKIKKKRKKKKLGGRITYNY